MTVNAASQAPLFSIILASNRQDNLTGLFDNLVETAASPHSFEVLVKVDEEDTDMVAHVAAEQARRPFTIRSLVSPKGGGYYTLHHAYQRLFWEYADPQAYFASVFTDEIRFKTPRWDERLAQYVGLFPDDVFRLRISDFRNKNYYRMYECLPEPENYAITTRKWYELTQGLFSLMPGQPDAFWGVDSWHQCIEYYLGQCLHPTMTKGVYRGWAIHDITVGGMDAGVGWEGQNAFDRARRVGTAWAAVNTRQAHENFYRLAQRLAAHVWAHHHGRPDYVLDENMSLKRIFIYAGPPAEHAAPLTERRFRLPWLTYLRERWPSPLHLHKPSLVNRLRNSLSILPAGPRRLCERLLRRGLILLARIWILRYARRLPHQIVENPTFKQVLVTDPRDGRPLRGWCYALG